MVCAVPSRTWARRTGGSAAVTRKSAQVTTAAPNAAVKMPSLASARSGPVNASAAISRLTVKPMPAIVPPPVTAAQPTGGRSRPPVSRVTSHDPATMPTGLPTTNAAMTPRVIGDRYA